jgi:hypothetical protein
MTPQPVQDSPAGCSRPQAGQVLSAASGEATAGPGLSVKPASKALAAAAAVLSKLKPCWHFGQVTLTGRSGTWASGTSREKLQCGQVIFISTPNNEKLNSSIQIQIQIQNSCLLVRLTPSA